MSKKQCPEKSATLHFPLQFTLPATCTEFGKMVDELQQRMRLRLRDWGLCFHGMDFDLYEENMKIHFSLFTRGVRTEDGTFAAIDIKISDNGMDVEYPAKWHTQESVEMMVDILIFYIDELQVKIKAARHA